VPLSEAAFEGIETDVNFSIFKRVTAVNRSITRRRYAFSDTGELVNAIELYTTLFAGTFVLPKGHFLENKKIVTGKE